MACTIKQRLSKAATTGGRWWGGHCCSKVSWIFGNVSNTFSDFRRSVTTFWHACPRRQVALDFSCFNNSYVSRGFWFDSWALVFLKSVLKHSRDLRGFPGCHIATPTRADMLRNFLGILYTASGASCAVQHQTASPETWELMHGRSMMILRCATPWDRRAYSWHIKEVDLGRAKQFGHHIAEEVIQKPSLDAIFSSPNISDT